MLHRDHLATVKAITDHAGVPTVVRAFTPYGDGEGLETAKPGAAQPESKGYIGERFDPETGSWRTLQRPVSPASPRAMRPASASSPAARRPETAPCRSRASRFWLSLDFAVTRRMAMRKATMPASIVSM